MRPVAVLGAAPSDPAMFAEWLKRAIAEIVRSSHVPDVSMGLEPAPGLSLAAHLMHTGGMPARVSTDGSNATPVVTETYICEVFIPANAGITGIALFNGSAVDGGVVVGLANSLGNVVAHSALAGTAQAGTDVYQRFPFTTVYAAKGPATY